MASRATIQDLRADVLAKRSAYQAALTAFDAYCYGTDRRGDPFALRDAYWQATTELNRAQYRLENHPDLSFELWAEMFEPHPVPYPTSC